MKSEDAKPDATKRFSFGKSRRLVSNSEFKAVLAKGKRLSDGLLTLCMAKNDCGYPRLGVSVGKSHGNAVVRNRLKRLLREAFRQSQDRIPAGFDYVLMIHPVGEKRSLSRGKPQRPKDSDKGETARQPTFEQIRSSFLALVNSLRRA